MTMTVGLDDPDDERALGEIEQQEEVCPAAHVCRILMFAVPGT